MARRIFRVVELIRDKTVGNGSRQFFRFFDGSLHAEFSFR